ncbi:MAG: UDP-N-acetylmuramoyl-tripeptide--D-alanyl-D-alanine ligase [Alphaproteobacteria bacterium]|nr:UDP-N-acetylmuramoyl-tripeptide--D-alanyl-D-alanine ligase [Alphaproteobacteria bacterium]
MTTPLWTTEEIIAATHGMSTGNWIASSVSIDTRTMAAGALFVALPGSRVDGHAHVAEALAQGAVGALVSRPVAGVDAARLVVVKDVEKALQQLGAAARTRSQAQFIGVTGSVGKTGAKEMLAAALAAVGKVYATRGNLNNHLGVPLNLANMPHDTAYAVIEMGMNHAGEIRPLSQMVQPHVALVTTVDAVHLEYFSSIEAIADEKSAIFDGMGGTGVAVLNADNAQYGRLKQHAQAKGMDRILSFGTGKQALCRMTHYAIDDTESVIEATVAGTALSYRIGTVGKHWALMSVAVLGVVDALGADLAKAAAALAQFTEPKGRGQIRKLSIKGGNLRLVDDAYNASPVSMKGAIEKIAEMRDASPSPVRTVVVLGDMLELGEHAEDLHVGLVPTLVNNQMDLVFAAGTFMEKMYQALPETMRGAYRPTSRELAPMVVEALRANDLVLVKGSHGSRMDVIVDAIEGNR